MSDDTDIIDSTNPSNGEGGRENAQLAEERQGRRAAELDRDSAYRALASLREHVAWQAGVRVTDDDDDLYDAIESLARRASAQRDATLRASLDAVFDTLESPAFALAKALDREGAWDWVERDGDGPSRLAVIEREEEWWVVTAGSYEGDLQAQSDRYASREEAMDRFGEVCAG